MEPDDGAEVGSAFVLSSNGLFHHLSEKREKWIIQIHTGSFNHWIYSNWSFNPVYTSVRYCLESLKEQK